jgi:hypothetical protein
MFAYICSNSGIMTFLQVLALFSILFPSTGAASVVVHSSSLYSYKPFSKDKKK